MDISSFIAVIGYVSIVYVFQRCLRFWWMMFRCYFLTTIGFVKDVTKYGEWVVVTGATDGIGKQYARQFAKKGLKIVLVSRTKEKLENVAKEIEEEFHVETKIICFNFSQTAGYEEMEKELSGLDIGILVNNVGTIYGGLVPFADKEVNQMTDIIHCNVLSDVRMTRIVINGMLERKWGLVIHVSSSVRYFNLKHFNIYPATKAFMTKLFKSLQMENIGVIRHQLVTPFVVSTNIVPVETNYVCPSAEDYVKSAIRTVGIADDTCGYWFHEIQKLICQSLPECATNYVMQKQLNYIFKL